MRGTLEQNPSSSSKISKWVISLLAALGVGSGAGTAYLTQYLETEPDLSAVIQPAIEESVTKATQPLVQELAMMRKESLNNLNLARAANTTAADALRLAQSYDSRLKRLEAPRTTTNTVQTKWTPVRAAPVVQTVQRAFVPVPRAVPLHVHHHHPHVHHHQSWLPRTIAPRSIAPMRVSSSFGSFAAASSLNCGPSG